MNFDVVYTVKKEFDKETFLRELLIELGTKNDTPVDIVDAEFQEVKESIREAIVCTAHVEGHCTASVGYDRQEPYTAYEKYTERIGDRNVTRERPVTKYRTVTDWQLFQTEYSGEATRAAYNSTKYGFDDSAIVDAIKTANEDSVTVKGEATVDPDGFAHVITACKTGVEINSVDFPGDHHKDANYNSSYEVESLLCYKLPYYEVVYTYKGKDYVASCFACGVINIETETPPSDINITKLVEEKTATLQKKKKFSWILFAASLALAAVLCIAFKFIWLFPLPVALLIKAQMDSAAYSKEYQKCSDNLSKDIAKTKVTALKAALEKRGFDPIDDELSESLDNSSVPGARKLSSIKGRVIFSWILIAALAISSIVVTNSNLHSPKQVDIDIVGKQVEYDPNARPYINGCYYVHFDYEITAKKTGVDYIELKVYVKDKDGNELGYIRSSLSDINLDAGNTKNITVTLSENQPENDDFFTALYNADFSDLEFEYEIGSIWFTDGKNYYNDDYDEFG